MEALDFRPDNGGLGGAVRHYRKKGPGHQATIFLVDGAEPPEMFRLLVGTDWKLRLAQVVDETRTQEVPEADWNSERYAGTAWHRTDVPGVEIPERNPRRSPASPPLARKFPEITDIGFLERKTEYKPAGSPEWRGYLASNLGFSREPDENLVQAISRQWTDWTTKRTGLESTIIVYDRTDGADWSKPEIFKLKVDRKHPDRPFPRLFQRHSGGETEIDLNTLRRQDHPGQALRRTDVG